MITTIEKDKYLSCWVVWLKVSENLQKDIYKARTKKECKEWLKCEMKKLLKQAK